jgi:methionine sulfoxide reductase heme-binding subunit
MAAETIAARRPAAAASKPPRRLPEVPRWLVYLVGMLPAVSVFYFALSGQSGPDPVRTLEHTLGLWALRFLVGGLAITPLRQLLRINLLRYRRAIGLLAFWYAALHVGVYLLLDQQLDMAAIVRDIVRRPYLTFGFVSFVILVPLAVTSNNASVRRLGGKLWARIHKAVYAAALFAVLHFIFVMKVWATEPLIYAAILAVLLGWRLVRALSDSRKSTGTVRPRPR